MCHVSSMKHINHSRFEHRPMAECLLAQAQLCERIASYCWNEETAKKVNSTAQECKKPTARPRKGKTYWRAKRARLEDDAQCLLVIIGHQASRTRSPYRQDRAASYARQDGDCRSGSGSDNPVLRSGRVHDAQTLPADRVIDFLSKIFSAFARFLTLNSLPS